tara:strand:+ start:36 stop:752 length:717 start_codon:yes stop_codon:yes gene_type:complete
MALPKLNTARYTIEIPSTGETVSYRPYLVKEEKILMMAMESNDPKAVINATKDIIKSCFFDDIDVDSLAMFDLETLFLALRSKSVGESVDLKLKCEDCGTPNDMSINFDDIETPVVDRENVNISITEDVGIVMKYPSVSEVEKYTGTDSDKQEDIETAMNVILACIDSIYDADNVYDAKDESEKSLTNFIESLSSVQFLKISEFLQGMPSLSYDAKFNCVSCGKENITELRGLSSFFT